MGGTMLQSAVYVEHFSFPPTERVIWSIKRNVSKLYGAAPAIDTGHKNALLDVSQCAQYALDRLESVAKATPNLLYAGSVVPLMLELLDAEGSVADRQGVIFVGSRNPRGNEWMCLHFLDPLSIPQHVGEHVNNCVTTILEERMVHMPNPTIPETLHIGLFTKTILDSVLSVLNKQTIHSTIQ